ncbi:hypothetical protein GUITHDRAFT_136435 [Guillardia theta CCMP2712]|uniref:Uncharacterized protein n=1 Tax=Guillardia theta (strain CCMP2712) TaxID=905079 RepID=L1JKD2_GUITC|nr:hypothetical protein GUITHDRAFT_136435 [Guillardia theta CCMP2712]EKX48762.1 hypothetical protein GUITHDRAFT_136435 [Guillardia theta CCMP2712]|eukprot:XP_005835742.1 hypothetical protein GUITHDRAFT_136435 [Guillardia theta CCMP2712]
MAAARWQISLLIHRGTIKVLADLEESMYERSGYSNNAHAACTLTIRRASDSLLTRLDLESKLEGHQSCVNALAFNRNGDLLASGCINSRVLIWHAGASRLVSSISTRHSGCIFGLEFARGAMDHSIWSCSKDGTIFLSHVDGVCSERPTIRHSESALQVLTDPLYPHVVLSCSSDGTVRQVDSRSPGSCGEEEENRANVLIDHRRLAEGKRSAEVLTMDINPCRPELLTTGGNESVVRSFDRRMLSVKGSSSSYEAREVEPVSCWSPHHLSGHKGRSFKGKVVTCVKYDEGGTSLLASFNRDRIYLLHPHHGDQFTQFVADEDKEATGEALPSQPSQRGSEQEHFTDSGNPALNFLSQTLQAVAQRRPIVLSDDEGTYSNLTVDMDGKLRFNSTDLIHRSLQRPVPSRAEQEHAAAGRSLHAAAERDGCEEETHAESGHNEQTGRNKPDEQEKERKSKTGKFSMRYQGHLSVRGLHNVIFFGSEEQYVVHLGQSKREAVHVIQCW